MCLGSAQKVSRAGCLERTELAEPATCADVSDASRFPSEKLSGRKPTSRVDCRHPKKTVIIFDWDDTLFPTSSAMRRDVHAPPGLACIRDSNMEKAVHRVKELLEMAAQRGHTFIVTNAEEGWVEESAGTWAPELLPVLNKIPILSARSKFEACCPDNPGQWKVLAFLDIRRQLGSMPITNLVSVGDSDFEMEAAKIMAEECQTLGEEVFVKTVKFKRGPTSAEHFAQVEAISGRFERIVTARRNLEVSLAKRESKEGVQ